MEVPDGAGIFLKVVVDSVVFVGVVHASVLSQSTRTAINAGIIFSFYNFVIDAGFASKFPILDVRLNATPIVIVVQLSIRFGDRFRSNVCV